MNKISKLSKKNSLILKATLITFAFILIFIAIYIQLYSYSYEEKDTFKVEGSAVRVSDSINTDSDGGSLIVTTYVSHSISWGIDVNSNIKKAISSEVSFPIRESISTINEESILRLNVAPYQNAHLVASPVYNVSEGTLYTYWGKRLIRSERVRIKSPSHYNTSLESKSIQPTNVDG